MRKRKLWSLGACVQGAVTRYRPATTLRPPPGFWRASEPVSMQLPVLAFTMQRFSPRDNKWHSLRNYHTTMECCCKSARASTVILAHSDPVSR